MPEDKTEIAASQDVKPTTMPVLVRSETDRSLEDAGKYKAIQTLTELGLFTPLSQIDTYHGRVGRGEKWVVNPAFSNGGNSTNNRNVNERPTLYTSSESTAKDFATARKTEKGTSSTVNYFIDKVRSYSFEEKQQWLNKLNEQKMKWHRISPTSPQPTLYTLSDLADEDIISSEALSLFYGSDLETRDAVGQKEKAKLTAEVHRIVAMDPEALVIDGAFARKEMSDEDKEKYYEAFRALRIPMTEGYPVEYGQMDLLDKFKQAVAERREYIKEDDVESIAQAAGIDEETALRLCSAFNTSAALAAGELPMLAVYILNAESDIFTVDYKLGDEKYTIPMNTDYVFRQLGELHVVAVKQKIWSATLDEDIESISFFDLHKIGTEDQIKAQRDEVEKLAGLSGKLPDLYRFGNTSPEGQLFSALAGSYTSPEKIVEAAKQIGKFDQIFESDAGNWEHFTLEEHTETVLRNFDENFADILPSEYLPFMRFIILIHDLGKPTAASFGQRHIQSEYNEVFAKDFMTKVGVDTKIQDLITAVITRGESLAFKVNSNPQDTIAEEEMRNFASESLRKYLPNEEVGNAQIDAFIQMCKIIQTCDGGAYTSMAITRKVGEDGKTIGRHRNYPSFNNSFEEPSDPGKRDLKWKIK